MSSSSSNTMAHVALVQHLLVKLNHTLKQCDMWQAHAPSAEAMMSTAPFCCDTMALEQWLQFIFIPRMQALIDAQHPLPTNVAICPMAEESFKHHIEQALPVIEVLAEIDYALSGKYTRAQQ